ncbi:hypothetical protein MKX08_002995 [Trichoderma sp. CBMAI-0020]|nr:hypothetical protein MKX08_002995 [Trichoderma sp. CBMAI-0020]
MYPSVQTASLMVQHGGNLYSKVDFGQQANIYKTLLVQRHPQEVLLRERFLLGRESLPKDRVEKGLCAEDFVRAPKAYPAIQKRKAVAIHCVRKQPKHCPMELLAFAAVDFLSGQFLINSRVVPNTGWNGSSRSERLHGWREARANLFDFIDQDTVIIGHRVQDDLEILRLLHKQIVDSRIVAMSAICRPPAKENDYKPYLENVCMDFLGIKLRQGTTCPLENALASREIVLHCIRWPKDLDIWAKETKSGFWREREERMRRRFAKRTKAVGFSAFHPATQRNAGSIWINGQKLELSDSGPPAAYDEEYQSGYQDVYEAGFANGFKVGYKRRYEQENVSEDCVEVEQAGPAAKRQKTHEPIRDADEHETLGYHGENASQENNTDTSQVAKARSLLAHLMRDTKITEIIQMLNQAQGETMLEREATSCQTGSAHVAADC